MTIHVCTTVRRNETSESEGIEKLTILPFVSPAAEEESHYGTGKYS